MNTRIIGLLFMLLAQNIAAQEMIKADETQSRDMIAEINQKAAELQSMKCEFVQTKHLSLLNEKMVSTGQMHYKQEKMLRWEYFQPYTYTFVLSEDKVMLRSSQKTDVIDVKTSRMFQEITRIMMNSVTGKSLTDKKDFQVNMYTRNKQWIAKLIPQRKEIKQMFSAITLYFDPEKAMVSEVEMTEKSGDITHIVLENIQTNIPLDEGIFNIH